MTIQVKPLQPALGAAVSHIDLTKPLAPDLIAEIRELWLRHKLLVFPNQALSAAQMVDFASQFGTVEIPPTLQTPPIIDPAEIVPGIDYVYSGPNNPILGTDEWHSDWSAAEQPTMALLLNALRIPSVGGDTIFVDMAEAYKGLPETVKARIENLSALHDTNAYLRRFPNPALRDAAPVDLPLHEHPIVRTHPETGQRILYVNALFTQSIPSLEPEESDRLLQFLYDQALVPEYQYRHRWSAHDLVFLDNRSTQHYACADYWPVERCLQRVLLEGDRPFK